MVGRRQHIKKPVGVVLRLSGGGAAGGGLSQGLEWEVQGLVEFPNRNPNFLLSRNEAKRVEDGSMLL